MTSTRPTPGQHPRSRGCALSLVGAAPQRGEVPAEHDPFGIQQVDGAAQRNAEPTQFTATSARAVSPSASFAAAAERRLEGVVIGMLGTDRHESVARRERFRLTVRHLNAGPSGGSYSCSGIFTIAVA